jgi:hypothetical protein
MYVTAARVGSSDKYELNISINDSTGRYVAKNINTGNKYKLTK